MSSEIADAIGAALGRLFELAAADQTLRLRLRDIAQAFLITTETALKTGDSSLPSEAESPSTPGGKPSETLGDSFESLPSSPRTAPAIAVTPPPADLISARQALSSLTLGSRSSVNNEEQPRATATNNWTPTTDSDLPLIEQRCRMKAEGARWAAERQRRLSQEVNYAEEIEPRDREIIEKARSIEGCYLWMNSRNAPLPTNLALWDDVAGCFDTMSAGLVMIQAVLADQGNHRDALEKGLDLLAEMQSALRASIVAIDGPPDSDQAKVFNWLKQTTLAQQVFIQRHMRVGDLADPATWPDIATRIEAVDAQVHASRRQTKQRSGRFNKIRYHLKVIRDGRGQDHDWKTVIATVGEMLDDGVQPSNVELRELLLPVVDDMPEVADIPASFQRVLQEIDRFLVSRPPEPEAARPQPLSAEVRAAARLLEGKSVLLIGGLCRPAAKKSLETALNLNELIWFETKEHESVDLFEPYVARPDVAVVIVAIRWSSHSYGEVKRYCEQYSKPFVRLPAGYNPNQVALQVVQQIGDLLAVPFG